MATIGTFTRTGDTFTDSVKTLSINAKATIKASDKASDRAPDYRIFSGSIDDVESGIMLCAPWILVCSQRTFGKRYPLLTDETCWFLAADFDKGGWEDDARALLSACRDKDIAAALERSRSGNGGHVWIFFQDPVPARTARQMGAALITETMERRPGGGDDAGRRSSKRSCGKPPNEPSTGCGMLSVASSISFRQQSAANYCAAAGYDAA